MKKSSIKLHRANLKWKYSILFVHVFSIAKSSLNLMNLKTLEHMSFEREIVKQMLDICYF